MTFVTVLGAGTWGTALAAMLSKENNYSVKLWSALESERKELKATHRHPNLEGMILPESIELETDLKSACQGAKIVVFAVPSPFLRQTVRNAAPFIADDCIIVDVAKGLEAESCMTLSEVIESELGNERGGIVALSGPTHAEEVAVGMPTAIVASSKNMDAAERIQHAFSNSYFRVYTNPDIKGIEVCGALKNIIAIAAGISNGLGYGDNAKAAIITRGMAEITRLGVSMGASEMTFASLAGIGDLVVTCTSRHSRNGRAGYLIGKGKSLDEVTREIGMAIEGLNALPAALKFADKYGVELPICSAVDRITRGELHPKDALGEIMARALKSE